MVTTKSISLVWLIEHVQVGTVAIEFWVSWIYSWRMACKLHTDVSLNMTDYRHYTVLDIHSCSGNVESLRPIFSSTIPGTKEMTHCWKCWCADIDVMNILVWQYFMNGSIIKSEGAREGQLLQCSTSLPHQTTIVSTQCRLCIVHLSPLFRHHSCLRSSMPSHNRTETSQRRWLLTILLIWTCW